MAESPLPTELSVSTCIETTDNTQETPSTNIAPSISHEKKAELIQQATSTVTVDENDRPTTPNRPKIVCIASKPSPRQRKLQDIKKIESTFDGGYDSDGQIGPFNYVDVLEGPQDFDEDQVSEISYLLQDPKVFEATNEEVTQTDETSSAISILDDHTDLNANKEEKEARHIPISAERIKNMKNTELKEELRLRGQMTSGKKKLLIDRLQTTIDKKLPVLPKAKKNIQKKNNKKSKKVPSSFSFPSTAHWRVLKAVEEVTEPVNPTFINARAPTINEKDQMYIPQKHNFKEKFDRPKFTGKLIMKDRYANGRLKLDKNKEPILITTEREKGIPNPENEGDS